MTIYNYTPKNQYKTANTGTVGASGVRFPMSGAAELSGTYQITGTVSKFGIPGPYRVALYERNRGRYLSETTSDADGIYLFDSIKYLANGYFVVAFNDNNGDPLNAAIADLITPESMP